MIRCTLCCALCTKQPLAAGHDRPQGLGPFIVPVAGERFDGLVCEIGRNLWPQTTARLRSALGAGLNEIYRDEHLYTNVMRTKVSPIQDLALFHVLENSLKGVVPC